MSLGDFVNQTLRIWEEAELREEMKGVRFDIAAEILRNTYSVKEMENSKVSKIPLHSWIASWIRALIKCLANGQPIYAPDKPPDHFRSHK